MSDFSNYIRVAIQGLPENSPLARASAYEKVRKVIKRQLEARSADEAEIGETLENLENAILDLEAEQLMLPAQAATPDPEKPRDTAPAFVAESNVTPISRKTADPAAREVSQAAKAGGVSRSGAPAPRAEKTADVALETNVVPRIADKPADAPAPSAPVAPQYAPQRAAALGGTAGQALKVSSSESDLLEEFQSALTAELSLPITPDEQSEAVPRADTVEDAHEEIAPEVVIEEQPAPPPEPEASEVVAGFDVKILLRKAVNSEDMRDPATREIIYRRARNALIKYLKSLSPQPDFDTVHAHIERLNAAIREVEAEQPERSADSDNADTGPSTDELMSELEDIWSADFDQADVEDPEPPRERQPSRPVAAELERTIADEVEEAVQELAETEFDVGAPEPTPEPEAPPTRSIDDEVEEAVQELIAADTARHKVSKNHSSRNSARRHARPAPPQSDDEFDERPAPASNDRERKQKAEEVDRWATDESFELPEDMFDNEFAVDEPAEPAAGRQSYPASEKPPRRGGAGRVFAILAVLIVAGLIGATVAFPDMTSRYAAKATTTGTWLIEFVAGLAGEPSRPAQDNGETEAAAAMDTRVPEVETIAAQPEPVEASAPEPDPANSEAAAEPVSVPAENMEKPAMEPAIAAADGEKAFLFSTSGGQQPVVSGNVAWSLIESSPQPGAPAEPAIRGDVAIPDDGLRATLTIRRNLDETLPATHLFEMVFIPANGVTSSEIASVEAVTFVQSVRDRSEALIGSVVKIADNIFLFALADVPAARQLHETLLRDPDLIEIQVVYYSGRRSTLRLVTGETGGQVFANALDAWAGETAGGTQSAPAQPEAAPPETAVPEAEQVEASPAVEADAAPPEEIQPEAVEPASAVPGRPVIPDVVPIPPDRPLFNG